MMPCKHLQNRKTDLIPAFHKFPPKIAVWKASIFTIINCNIVPLLDPIHFHVNRVSFGRYLIFFDNTFKNGIHGE